MPKYIPFVCEVLEKTDTTVLLETEGRKVRVPLCQVDCADSVEEGTIEAEVWIEKGTARSLGLLAGERASDDLQ